MSDQQDWLDTLYVRNVLAFFSDALSKLFPKVNSKIVGGSEKVPKLEPVRIEPAIAVQRAEASWMGWIKGWFAMFGASVLIVSSPFLIGYVWNYIRTRKWFILKEAEIANKGIVITGCDSGIGLETAALLSSEYPSVYIFAGCLTASGVQKLGTLRRSNLIPIKIDVTSDTEVRSFVASVRSQLGTNKLYAIINNAGVYDGTFVEATPIDVYSNVMDVNFFGVIRVTKALLPLLLHKEEKQNGGRIINISSLAGLVTSPGVTAYCASKHALTAFSDGLRQEVKAMGIKVIQIVCGPVKTGALRQIPISTSKLLMDGPSDTFERIGGQSFVAANARFFADLFDTALSPVTVSRTIQKALIHRHPKDVYYEADGIFCLMTICPHYMKDFLMDPTSFQRQIIKKYAK